MSSGHRSGSATEFGDYRSRARLSDGRSADAIHRMVANAIAARNLSNVVLVDVGCGNGDLLPLVAQRCRRYVGVDAVRYEGLPASAEFIAADLNDCAALSVGDAQADVVVAVETIEHLENPRAFMRLLARLARPGGWIIVTTPNQRSALSLATLMTKGQHSQFQDVHYPAHITALLDIDLRRMAAEIGLDQVSIDFSRSGRIVFTPLHYPAVVSGLFPVACSDNLMLVGRRPV